MQETLRHFIVFEGLDGVGTTTHALRLSEFIKSTGRSVAVTREPSDGAVGSFIREKVLKSGSSALGMESLLHLYLADRADHLYREGGVADMLDRCDFVISDRYFFSTLAYQGVELGFDSVLAANMKFPLPEAVFYLDIPVSECMDRIERRGGAPELFEKRNFLEKTKSLYERAFAHFGSLTSCFRIDSGGDIEATEKAVRDKFLDMFPL